MDHNRSRIEDPEEEQELEDPEEEEDEVYR